MNKKIPIAVLCLALVMLLAISLWPRDKRHDDSVQQIDDSVQQIEKFVEWMSSYFLCVSNRLEQIKQTGTPDEKLDNLSKELKKCSNLMQKEVAERKMPDDFKEKCLNLSSSLHRLSNKYEEHPHIPNGAFDLQDFLKGVWYGFTFDFRGASRDVKKRQSWYSDVQHLCSESDEAQNELINCAIMHGATIPESYW